MGLAPWLVALVAVSVVAVEDDVIFSVIRATPTNEAHLRFFNSLFKDAQKHELDFWKSPTAIGYSVDIMAPSIKILSLASAFNDSSIPNNITIKDVQKLIIEREQRPSKSSPNLALGSFLKRFNDDPVTSNRAKFVFGEYHGYGEIVRWLNEIAQQYPNIARVLSIGTTSEGRNIIAIKIGSGGTGRDKRVVWIDGGIHAREWGAIHTALYFIEQLIVGYESSPQIRSFVDALNIYVVPVVNPDGFEYTRSDITPMKRLWRKNRAGITCTKDQWFRDRCCGGVDLNRNFDFNWGATGSSDDPCSEIYQGSAAFSELESQAVRDMLLSPELHGKVDAFITLHTYSQMWIHPYSHARRSVPADIAELKSVGEKAVAALEAVYGTKYRFGTGADILYPSSGGSDDWAKAKGGAKYVYLLELRPGEEVWDGFVLDSRQLIPMGKETWEGVKVVIQAVVDKQQSWLLPSQIVSAQQAARQPVSTTPWQPSSAPRTLPPSPVHFTRRVGGGRGSRPRRPIRRRKGKPTPRPSPPPARVVSGGQQSRLAASRALCRDLSPWCRAWIRGNPDVCRVSSIYMSRDCRATCRYC